MEPIIHTCRTHFWHLFHPANVTVDTPRALVMDNRTLKSVTLTVTQAENLVCDVCANLRIADLPKTPRMQHTSAVFYIEPSSENIAILQKELSRNNQQLLHFKEYHIVFTRNITDEIISQLARCDTHSKIRSVRIIFGDFIPTGLHALTFSTHPSQLSAAAERDEKAKKKLILRNDVPSDWTGGIQGLSDFVQKRKTSIRNAIVKSDSVESFASAILAMGVQPFNIRYQANSKNAMNFSNELSRILSNEINSFPINYVGERKPNTLPDSRFSKPIEVIIVDRRTDMITPLVTYWSYESLVDSTLGIGDTGEVNTFVPRNFVYDNAFTSESDRADAAASRSKLAQKYIIPLSWSTMSTNLFKTISGLDYVSATLAIEKMTRDMKMEEDERKRVRESTGMILSGKANNINNPQSAQSSSVALMKLSAQMADTEKNDTRIRELNNLTKITEALNQKLKICGENQDIELCKRIALLEQQIVASIDSESLTLKAAAVEINKMITGLFTNRVKLTNTPRARIVVGKTLVLYISRMILLVALAYRTKIINNTNNNNNNNNNGGLSSQSSVVSEIDKVAFITEINGMVINLIKYLQPIVNAVFSTISKTQGIDVIGTTPNEAYEKEYVDLESICSGLYIALQEILATFGSSTPISISAAPLALGALYNNPQQASNDILNSTIICIPVTPDKIKAFVAAPTKKLGKAAKDNGLTLSQEALEMVIAANETVKKYLTNSIDERWFIPTDWSSIEAAAERSMQILNSYGGTAPVSQQRPEGSEYIMERDNNRSLFLHKPPIVSVAEAAVYSNLPEDIFPSDRFYLDNLSRINNNANVINDVKKLCTRSTKDVHSVIICVIGGVTVAESVALRMHRVLGTQPQLYRKNQTTYDRMSVLTGENVLLCGPYILNKEDAYKGIIGM